MFKHFTKLSRTLAAITLLGMVLSMTGVASASPNPVVTEAHKHVSLAAHGYANLTATCPAGSVVTGGGWQVDTSKVHILASMQDNNGWMISVSNTSNSATGVDGYAECLSGISGAGSVSQGNTIYVNAHSNAYPNPQCSQGVATDGGFGSSASISVNASEPAYPSGWIVIALNNSNSTLTLANTVTCLTGTNATISVVHKSAVIHPGQIMGATATCPAGSVVVGGGWGGDHNVHPMLMNKTNNNAWTVWSENTSNVDANFTTSASCAKFH